MKPLRGFTLIELLIVTAIIAVLIALLLVGYPKISAILNNIICQSNLKSVHQTLLQYAELNDGWFPDCQSYYGLGFCRYYLDNTASPPLSIAPWDAMTNVRQLKQLGASADTFFCPMSPDQSATATFWEKDRNSWTTPNTRPQWWCDWSLPAGKKRAWVYVGYVLLFCRGYMNSQKFIDDRPVPTRTTCGDDYPLVADNLHCRSNMFIMGGWYHGGGTSEIIHGGPGLFNSGCNTLFAGGHIVHKEWEDLEAQGPAMIVSNVDMWWFWLGKDSGN